jgi:hypothetical protein
LTKANWDRIVLGMTTAEVESLLGPANLSRTQADLKDLDSFDLGGTAAWKRGISYDTDPRNGYEQRYWLGEAGFATVGFYQGRVVDTSWMPRATLLQRVNRQWRKWFPAP